MQEWKGLSFTVRWGGGRLSGLVIVTVVNLLISTGFYLMMTTMVVHTVERYRAGDGVAGLTATAFVGGATAGRLLAGPMIVRLTAPFVLLAGLLGFTCASLAHLHPGISLPILMGIRTVHGVSFGLASTAAVAVAQQLMRPERRATATAYFTLSSVLAAAMGPIAAAWLIRASGYHGLFVGSATIAGFAMVLGITLVGARSSTIQRRVLMGRSWMHEVLDLPVARSALTMTVMGAAFACVLSFIVPFTRSLALPGAPEMFFIAYATVVLVSRLFVGHVQDRFGASAVVYPAMVAFALGLACLGLATSLPAVVTAGVLIGLGFGTLLSAMQVIAVSLAQGRIGVAVSTYLFMLDAGTGIGPLVFGWVAQLGGFRSMYLLVASLVLFTALIFRVPPNRRAPSYVPG